jgi:hypothetical protein
MSYRLLIIEDARGDELAAYTYYENLLAGLGEDFLQTLASQYSALQENPNLYSYIDNQTVLRDVKLMRFPYVVIFEVIENTVVVFAVHCTHRKVNT